MACSGLATAPPCRPECRSFAAPVSVNSSPASPRLEIVTDGSLMRHMPPSAEMTKSAASRSVCAWMNGSRLGLPISSSPSNMNLTLTGRLPCVAKNACAALTAWKSGPLSSDTPRA